MKTIMISLLAIFLLGTGTQVTYFDFEEKKNEMMEFGQVDGILKTRVDNPDKDKINSSEHCGKYVRSEKEKFANLKINLAKNLSDVSVYTANEENTPRFSMKLHTSAPAGTKIQLQVGSSENDEFPAGVNSIYEATTTKQNAWQNIQFEYVYSPEKSEVLSTEADQIVILFAPNSSTKDTYYFDDLTGPDFAEDVTGKAEKK